METKMGPHQVILIDNHVKKESQPDIEKEHGNLILTCKEYDDLWWDHDIFWQDQSQWCRPDEDKTAIQNKAEQKIREGLSVQIKHWRNIPDSLSCRDPWGNYPVWCLYAETP